MVLSFWVLSLMSTPFVFAQNLDLGGLAGFNYVGKEASDNKTPCNLNVSEISRDFGGRLFQDFRIWVNGRSDLNFNLRLRGANRNRTPEKIEGPLAYYHIAIDVYNLILVTDVGNPLQISEFRLNDASGMSQKPTLMKCTSVKASPR